MEALKDPPPGDETSTDFLIKAVPCDVVLDIGDYLCATDRWALMRTCWGLHKLLEPLLWHRGPDCSRARGYLLRKYKRMVYRCSVDDNLESSHAGALLWALEHKAPEVARKALRLGAADERLVKQLVRPAVAYKGGCVAILELFLQHLLDRTKLIDGGTETDSHSTLFGAASFGTPTIFKALLRYGADPNVSLDRIPIIYKLKNDFGNAVVELLIEYGADVLVRVKGLRPLRYAIREDKAYMLPLLAATGIDLHASRPNRVVPNELCRAVRRNAQNCVIVLVEGGSDPLVMGATGVNAVSTGRINDKRIEIWRTFLDNGVPINMRHGNGQTMLIMAARYRAEKLTRFLLERGADATLKDNNGNSAVDYAFARGSFRYPEELALAAAITAAACKQSGDTAEARRYSPWRMAVSTGRWDLIVSVLQLGGYDPCARDERGQTFLMHAAQMCAGRKTRPYDFFDNRQYFWGRRLEAVAQKDDDGNTALYWAVVAGDKYLCKRLLRAGSDANTPAGDGRSLLSVAARSPPAIMRRLLLHVEDVNAQDKDGRTALSYVACNTGKTAMREMVRMLMAAGAKPSRRIRDCNGLRPMGWARNRGQEDKFRDAVITWRLPDVK
ncbi:hypothetical protein PWT90_03976 [Aphanocladium album]|nr:hypothetical protein PWT90_03976 [Aphanocladium album]